ncbi:hypothetical protein Hanom_Chr11g01047401 [Helianthus anomalus]
MPPGFFTFPPDSYILYDKLICAGSLLYKVGLTSSVNNESINFETLEDYYPPMLESGDTQKMRRDSKSKKITRNDITKVFGLPKADTTYICRIWYNFTTLSENTFTEAHQRYGVDKWPCIRSEIVKSSAHKALIEHAKAFLITSSDVARRIKPRTFVKF